MEIITIPLSGSIAHKDSMGNSSIIKTGEIQVMSAGTGIQHSEFNPNKNEALSLFQIWIFPNKRNVEPRYDQFEMDVKGMQNNFLQLISPNEKDEGTWIHQDAWIKIAEIDENTEISYALNSKKNGVYFMLINGEVSIDNDILKQKDALGVWNTDIVLIKSKIKSKILAIEIPMEFV
jgi:redox-sensitive bicupin YhaK (pirin superfamily)